MKLAAMQPYFFPYLGQFHLLNQVDRWIVYDQGQFIRHGWVSRNRVLHPTESWQYVLLPLKRHSHKAPISQVEMYGNAWARQVDKKLEHYHMDAPYYPQVMALLNGAMDPNEVNLARLNIALIRATAAYLGIDTEIIVLSEEMEHAALPSGAQQVALAICRHFGATQYVNSPGGRKLYNPLVFQQAGIGLTFQDYTPMQYVCGRYSFIPDLSILDVMMWNAPEQIKAYISA